MRIAIVGPTHPYKGGIPQATTELAHRLKAKGHQVRLISWKAMYPGLLYPGEQFVPLDKPELPVYADTERLLSWKNPIGWWQRLRQLRTFDQVIFVWWVPTIQGPVYLTMLKALGRSGPKTALICHNVLPHEPRPGDRAIAKAVFNRMDRIIVHTPEQQAIAKKLTKRPIEVAALPAHIPGKRTHAQDARKQLHLHYQLLFFGFVRKYKGLDILLRALASVPDISLVVAGEFWGAEVYEQLIRELGIDSRVKLLKGYVAAEDLPKLFRAADALVLPYREGTATQNVAIAHTYTLPVIATTAGSMGKQVHDAIDGLLCKPNDVASLTAAIKHFYEPGVAAKLRSGIQASTGDGEWQDYIEALGD